MSDVLNLVRKIWRETMGEPTKIDAERELLSVQQICLRISELNICQCSDCDWLDLEPVEIFKGWYRPLGTPPEYNFVDETKKFFDIRRSKLWSMHNTESESGFDCEKIDLKLCEAFGINVDPWQAEEFTNYELVGRKIPLDYEKLDYMRVYKIRVPNQGQTSEAESRKIGDKYYQEIDLSLINCPLTQHFSRTDDYNKKLLRAVKVRFLYQASQLSENLLGHVRTPFDVQMNPHVKKYFRSLPTDVQGQFLTDPQKWLNQSDWLDQITDLSSWARSTIIPVNGDLKGAMKWIEKSAHEFWVTQKLSDTKNWRERDEGEYIHFLKIHSVLLQISAQMNRKIAVEVMYSLESAVRDLGYLFQTIIER